MNEFESDRFKRKKPRIHPSLQEDTKGIRAPLETRKRLVAMAKITGYSVTRCLIECIDGIHEMSVGKNIPRVPNIVAVLRTKKSN
jgi:hypothetical protein